MRLLLRQILLTLSYSDQFKFPLTTRELVGRVLAPTQGKLPEFSASSWFAAMHLLLQQRRIAHRAGFWSLPLAEETSSQYELRWKNALHTEKKLADSAWLLTFFQYLPWVRAVAITGSAAVASAGPDDDLDFLIVTAHNRLWLVRAIAVLLAFFAGKRRTWQKEEPDSWCFNLWLEEDQLVMPFESRSVYTAYEVVQAGWVVDKDQVVRRFRLGNNWSNHFLPYTAVLGYPSKPLPQPITGGADVVLTVLDPGLSLINFLSYLVQRLYMRGHQTREKVALPYAFFHPRDTKKSIYANWRSSIASIH